MPADIGPGGSKLRVHKRISLAKKNCNMKINISNMHTNNYIPVFTGYLVITIKLKKHFISESQNPSFQLNKNVTSLSFGSYSFNNEIAFGEMQV